MSKETQTPAGRVSTFGYVLATILVLLPLAVAVELYIEQKTYWMTIALAVTVITLFICTKVIRTLNRVRTPQS